MFIKQGSLNKIMVIIFHIFALIGVSPGSGKRASFSKCELKNINMTSLCVIND